jgi:hypothetical protein
MSTMVTVVATDLASLRKGLLTTEVEIKPEPKKKYMVQMNDKSNCIRFTNKLFRIEEQEIDGQIVEVEVARFRPRAVITEL